MKKQYKTPMIEIDILKYEISDIITTSIGDNDLPVPEDWF